MKKEIIISGLVGLLVGGLLVWLGAVNAVNSNNQGAMQAMGMRLPEYGHDNQGMSMDDMTASLRDNQGDEFDKTFLAHMIDHHQGAVDMAELTMSRAKHDEIKQMAQDIIKVQTDEIDMMRDWQSAWGYDVNAHGMGH